MSNIKVMSPSLANMIAAGEVVDRPASVIKELVENAIDAQATHIKVEVFEMGMSKMIITDDGIGMDFLDAHLAFERHATSKIMDAHDLNHISTLGFRGEALAAIASVSKVLLKTRQKDTEGISVSYHGGKHIKDGKAALNQGTIIEISDLFYNTPARYKYIKSEMAERSAITDIFDRMALANPEIRMQLFMDDKLVKETYGQNDFYQLIDQVYGQKMTKDMAVFEEVIQKISIKGYLLSPQITRSRKKDISIFVNGRYIKNYALIQAVIEGYHSMIMVKRYPIALIHLNMDPSLLDVNVHPQKYEVKFVNESILAYHIETLIKQALKQKVHQIPENLAHIKRVQNSEQYHPQSLDFNTSNIQEPTMHYQPIEQNQTTKNQKIPDMDFIGIFSGTYLLFQNHEGLYLIDQHAAQERIRYEHYVYALSHPNKTIKHLLIPYELQITPQDQLVIKKHSIAFEKEGFLFDQNGHLIGHPIWLLPQEIELAIEKIVTMLDTDKHIDLSKLRDHLAKDISCKGAIKANQRLNTAEVKALYQDLKKAQNPYTCPHGRPTVIKLSHYDIEKMFKRVVS